MLLLNSLPVWLQLAQLAQLSQLAALLRVTPLRFFLTIGGLRCRATRKKQRLAHEY